MLDNAEAPEGYDALPHLFLELRGRGHSLSAIDGEILFAWKELQVPTDVIVDLALKLAEECIAAEKPFPSTLVPIDRRVKRYLKKQNEL